MIPDRKRIKRPARQGGHAALLLVALFALFSLAAEAQEQLQVTVRQGQSLRDLAREYLDDPDLWGEILRANDLEDAADLHPGMGLAIPANEISRTTVALQRAVESIESATVNGARLFAPEELSNALNALDRARLARKESRWGEARELALTADDWAKRALQRCRENQNLAAEAVVQYRKGNVQSRSQQSRVWEEAESYKVLMEGDRVRTLSQSYAGILFRDDSRLRMEENSLAYIQRMRYNRLLDSEHSTISLLQGDLFAFLDQGRKADRFELELEGVETDIRSSAFWVSRNEEKEETRFANYEGEIEVTVRDETLVMGANQGSVITPMGSRLINELLPRPRLANPGTFARIEGNSVAFAWHPLEDAGSYWLEVARDKEFGDLLVNRSALKDTAHRESGLERGLYYWRVSAVDTHGLPGPKSDVRLIAVLDDRTAPFLLVSEPASGAILAEELVVLRGETEPGAQLAVAGKTVDVMEDGGFEATLLLGVGRNLIPLIVRDPAGNVLERELLLYHHPERQRFNLSLEIARTGSDSLPLPVSPGGTTLRGTTGPEHRVSIHGLRTPHSGAAIADSSGRFSLNAPLQDDEESYLLTDRNRIGAVREDSLFLAVDGTPPEITWQSLPERYTTAKTVRLAGQVRGAVSLQVNGRAVQLDPDGHFDHTLLLEEGVNGFLALAVDQVGNRSERVLSVFRDTTPPVIQSYSADPDQARRGGALALRVVAEDAGELARLARVNVRVNGYHYEGYLHSAGTSGQYSGTVELPANVSGPVIWERIQVSDYLGNRATLTP